MWVVGASIASLTIFGGNEVNAKVIIIFWSNPLTALRAKICNRGFNNLLCVNVSSPKLKGGHS